MVDLVNGSASESVCAGNGAKQPVTRSEAEVFLAKYHEAIWDAAQDGSGIDYDMAGVDLAKEFLNKFDDPSEAEVA